MARNEHRRRDAERPWHERTPMVLGASIAALLAIALMYFAAVSLSRHYNEPKAPPPLVVDNGPAAPATIRTTSSETTTTETNAPVLAPSTSEIENPVSDTSEVSGASGSSGSTSTTTTTSPPTPTSITQSRHSHTPDRLAPGSRPPRYNETRTLYPPP